MTDGMNYAGLNFPFEMWLRTHASGFSDAAKVSPYTTPLIYGCLLIAMIITYHRTVVEITDTRQLLTVQAGLSMFQGPNFALPSAELSLRALIFVLTMYTWMVDVTSPILRQKVSPDRAFLLIAVCNVLQIVTIMYIWGWLVLGMEFSWLYYFALLRATAATPLFLDVIEYGVDWIIPALDQQFSPPVPPAPAPKEDETAVRIRALYRIDEEAPACEEAETPRGARSDEAEDELLPTETHSGAESV